jgi:hypothetical protein
VANLPYPPVFHLTPKALTFAGPSDRFQKNLAALKLVHQLEAEDRTATDDERLVLAHYSQPCSTGSSATTRRRRAMSSRSATRPSFPRMTRDTYARPRSPPSTRPSV